MKTCSFNEYAPRDNELEAGQQDLGVQNILDECSQDEASWLPRDLPNTITLRRMIALADWASREPKRWSAYRLRYIEGIESSEHIAQKLHVSDRTVRRWLEPVRLARRIKPV